MVSIELGDPTIRMEQLDLVKPIYTAKRIERTQDLALRQLETRKISKAVVERALDLTAHELAYNVLRSEQLAEVAEQRASAVAAHLDLSKKLMRGGVVAKFEVVQAETELARSQGDVIGAQTLAETAKAGLKLALNLPQTAPLGVTRGPEYKAPPGDQRELIQGAWQERPEVRVAQAAIKLAEAALRLAATSRSVSVNLVSGLTHTTAQYGSEPLSWQVAVQATKPILDGNAEKNEVRSAKAQLDATRLELEKTKQEIALDVTQSLLALEEAQQRLRVAQQGLVEARERVRIAQVRYTNGIALGVEVLDAQTALASAQAERVNSDYNLQLATVKLRSAIGLWGGSDGGHAHETGA